MSNALTVQADNWDVATDDVRTANPKRGSEIKFDSSEDAFGIGKAATLEEGRQFSVLDFVGGWQCLRKGQLPEWLLHMPADGPKPDRPHLPESEWPLNMAGKPEHAHKWTFWIYMVDANTGEAATFWTSTVGGKIAVGELKDQIRAMRRVRPGAVPIVELESRLMPTQYGSKKPRPHFQIKGWRVRGDDGEQRQIAEDTVKVNEFNDCIPF
jgi:hypothetical protein